jgi:Skp family chaperone for outer membrane proteins
MVFAGCDDSGGGDGSSSGRVAVVDLNKIAEDIGQASKIKEASQVRDRNLQISVRDLQQRVQAQLVVLAEKIGKKPEKVADKATEAEQKLIDEWVGKMRNLERARLDAGNKIRQAYNQQRQANQQAVRAEITKMRDRIKPLAQRVARDKGLDIVVTSSSVLVHGDSVDITAAVFKEVNELLKAGSFPTVTIPDAVPVPVRPPSTTTAPAGGTAPKKGATTTP